MNEQEKKQALKLSLLWKVLHDKGTYFERCLEATGRWGRTGSIPDMKANLSLWRVADKPVEPKPVAPKKIIDLTMMVGADVDMEFTDCGEAWVVIGKLHEIFDHNYPYQKLNGGSFECCRVRQDHIHYYNGVGNPLPDGLLVTLYFYNDSNSPPVTCKSQDIVWNKLYNVSGYEVIGTWPEYKYGWEK